MKHLRKVVEDLRERIELHRAALHESEALTRYTLIDPLLRGLGWDTEHPELVRPEYPIQFSPYRRVDYALLRYGKSPILIEATSLSSSLDSKLSQGSDYLYGCKKKVEFFAVTDGRYWKIYATRDCRLSEELAAFDVKRSPAAVACIQALALWKPFVDAGLIFNYRSQYQLTKVMTEVLEFPTTHLKMTPTGLVSIMRSDLEELRASAEWSDKQSTFLDWLIASRPVEPLYKGRTSPVS